MGRKKYYCEYCDKSFNDDLSTRSKHLASINHVRLKEEHYSNFRDPAIIFKDESKKKPCINYHNEGNCRFGSSCRFSHYSREELERLQNSIELPKESTSLPLFNDWISRTVKMENSPSKPLSYEAVNLPADLPPSLKPYDVLEYLRKDVATW